MPVIDLRMNVRRYNIPKAAIVILDGFKVFRNDGKYFGLLYVWSFEPISRLKHECCYIHGGGDSTCLALMMSKLTDGLYHEGMPSMIISAWDKDRTADFCDSYRAKQLLIGFEKFPPVYIVNAKCANPVGLALLKHAVLNNREIKSLVHRPLLGINIVIKIDL